LKVIVGDILRGGLCNCGLLGLLTTLLIRFTWLRLLSLRKLSVNVRLHLLAMGSQTGNGLVAKRG
jgi:hypothetical protein